METIFKPGLKTISITTIRSNGVKIFKCHDPMFDNIVERALRTQLLW